MYKTEVSQIVNEEVLIRNCKQYDLIAYTVMPNHVHIVFIPKSNIVVRSEASNKLKLKTKDGNTTSQYLVTKILQDLKSKTALRCNKILSRSGSFWQHESYDHVIRNRKELRKVVKYVIYDPVKAGLVKKWNDWKWSYYNPKYLL